MALFDFFSQPTGSGMDFEGATTKGGLDLFDPRMMALMGLAQGLTKAGAPSPYPVSLGSALSQGLGGASQGAMQGFQMQQQQKSQEQNAALQALKMQQLQEEIARQRGTPLAYGPGTQLFRPGEPEPFRTVPFKTDPTPTETKPPPTRTVRIGEEQVTQEYVGGQWREVGRGPAFAKTVPTPPGAAKPVAPPRAPQGYRFTDSGDLEAIPGGPKDQSKKEGLRAEGAKSRAELVMGKVDDALGKVGFLTTGIPGAVMGMVPGRKAYDLRRDIDTIKANIGFAELQAMREASPTGGALGQVAVQELNMLQAVLSSLDANQSEESLRQGLTKVKQHYENWKKAVEQSQGGSEPVQAPKKGDVVDGYEFIGGDPSKSMNWRRKK